MQQTNFGIWRTAVAAACLGSLTLAGVGSAQDVEKKQDAEKKKPSVAVRASPQSGFSPLKVVATAELRGGSNDYQEFYCPVIEWEWGDGTRSEQRVDCDPYEAGKSEVKRRYTVQRTYHTAGEYRVVFRMKQANKVVGSGQTTLRIRPGVGDRGGWPQ